MKKILQILLLCFVVITMFASCNNDAKKEGEILPVDTTAKPKLGYVDLNHWYDIMIMRKDMETVKPLIRGTHIKDSILGKGTILIYTQESDCGTFWVEYFFDAENNSLTRIYAEAYSERDPTLLKTPAEVMKHGKIISDEMNSFTQSFNDGQDLIARGRYMLGGIQMYKNNVPVTLPDYQKKYNQEKYKLTWEYLDGIIARGLADDESIWGPQIWAIRDDVEFPDGRTPEVMTLVHIVSFAECDTTYSGRAISVQFQRLPGISDENNLTTPNI